MQIIRMFFLLISLFGFINESSSQSFHIQSYYEVIHNIHPDAESYSTKRSPYWDYRDGVLISNEFRTDEPTIRKIETCIIDYGETETTYKLYMDGELRFTIIIYKDGHSLVLMSYINNPHQFAYYLSSYDMKVSLLKKLAK